MRHTWDTEYMKGDTIFKVRRSSGKIKRVTNHIVKTPIKLKKIVARARQIHGELDKVRPLYSELDAITTALLSLHNDKRACKELLRLGCLLVDNFAEKNTVFRNTAIRRYEIRWK